MVYMLALIGANLDLQGVSEAVGIGLLFSARGLGTGIGPIVGRALFTNQHKWPLVMGLCIVLSGITYSTTAVLSWSLWIIAPVMLAHALSGANWVFSTVLLQQRTEDAFRGRVFATEWLLLTLTNVVVVLAASLLLEYEILTLRQGLFAFSAVMLLSGVVWLALVVPAEREPTTRSR